MLNENRQFGWAAMATLIVAALSLAGGCGTDGGSGPGTDTGVDVAADTLVGDTVSAPDTTEPPDTTPPATTCASNGDCAADAGHPICDTAASICVPLPRGHQIGWRSGAADSVVLTPLVQWNQTFEATDLAFHPERDELWIVNRPFEVAGECTQATISGARCASLAGFVTIIFDPGTPDQRAEVVEDGNAWHFMRRPPAMAMGANDTWATCGEASTGNFEDDGVNFIGPTLWSSDLSVFGPGPPALNGSHLDMLHATPYCMGIAHEHDNVYWVFNGHVGAIDRYDFADDHGPGHDDHSDGEILRYVQGQLERLPGVPSHLAFNPDDAHVYIADTGNGRIVKLDTTSGAYTGKFSPVYEQLAHWGNMGGATLTEVVPPGVLTEPSGLALHDGLVFVTDAATSRFYAFELDGTVVRSQDTTLPSNALGGIAIGPDDRLYFAHMLTGEVYRLDPQ